jgi:hypothetical protein
MLLEEKYELFEQQMQNTLTAEEAAKLQLLLKEDANAELEMEEYIAIQEQLESMTQNQQFKKDFIGNLKYTAQQYPASPSMATSLSANSEQAPKGLTFSKNLRWIASIAALLVIGFFVFNNKQSSSKSMQELYASNYSIEPVSMERGSVQDSLQQIIELYTQKQYSQASPLLSVYCQAHPDKTDLQLANAICNLEQKNTPKAIELLQSIISSNTLYTEKAQWYLAMAYLQNGNKEKVNTLLQSFSKEHFYYAKAQSILQSLP